MTAPWPELAHLVDLCNRHGVDPSTRTASADERIGYMLTIRHLEHALIGADLTPDQIWRDHWTQEAGK